MEFILENFMYEATKIFLLPVLVLIVSFFTYSLFQLGVFMMEIYQRRKYSKNYEEGLKTKIFTTIKGYAISSFSYKNSMYDSDKLELFAYEQLEKIAITTKLTPMLGLVATMIPMGPALKSLADGNVQGVSENLAIAFSAVVVALISASISYVIYSVRKRWYAKEILDIVEIKNETPIG